MPEKRIIELDKGTGDNLFAAFQAAEIAKQVYEDLAQEQYDAYGLDTVNDKVTVNLITRRITAVIADRPPGTEPPEPPTPPKPVAKKR